MAEEVSIISTLETYKNLTSTPSNLKQLLKEKTIVLYVSTLLESTDHYVLNLCLDILDNFVRNEKSHEVLISTFGTFEALESLAIRMRHSDHSWLAERSTEILDILRNSAPPAYSTRHRRRGNASRKTTLVYLLHINELTAETRSQLDEALLQTKGIISFVVDLEQKRCTVRVSSKLPIKTVLAKIKDTSGMLPRLVSRSTNKEEVLMDILNTNCSDPLYPDYFPEEDSPPKENAIKARTGSPRSSSAWFKAASDFLTGSFYW